MMHLIVSEHDGKEIKKATLSAIAAAKKLEGACHGVLLGENLAEPAAHLAKFVEKVHVIEHESLKHRLAQPYSKAIVELVRSLGATHIWTGASVAGKDMMPRVAAALEAGMASDIQGIVDEKTFKRPMWAGDMVGTVELTTLVKVITVRATEFTAATPSENGEVVRVGVSASKSNMRFVSFDKVESERPELADADVVVSGGRGLKGPEGFKQLIEPLADKLGAAIGASRAVCDAGWVPNDWQVGQTGKVVAPELYVAIGISGAIQHVAGMKGSKVIVAINKDPDAPIFQVADYGLVADAFQVVPELIDKARRANV